MSPRCSTRRAPAAALAERKAQAAADAAATAPPKKREPRARAQEEAEEGAAPQPPPREVLVETGWPIRIREVRIESGQMNFSDQFIQPNFAADIKDLDGQLTGLSTDPNSSAKVDLKGEVGEFSPVTIAGEIQLFAFDRHTDIGLKFENIPLPVFNPYSGRFAGYNIAKGSLTTDLHYLIENRKLEAKHHIRIDQLEWGEATASKEAVPLPIKLATSLLKDVDGVIDLDVPVNGTLDDPKFRIGPIVWQIIKNILVKVVTAPFRLLGSLFKGAEDAQFVQFAPGDATLDPAAAEQMSALAKGLAQKPEIKLDVPIGMVEELDRPAMVDRALATEIEAATRTVMRIKPDDGNRAAGPGESRAPAADRGADQRRRETDRRRAAGRADAGESRRHLAQGSARPGTGGIAQVARGAGARGGRGRFAGAPAPGSRARGSHPDRAARWRRAAAGPGFSRE